MNLLHVTRVFPKMSFPRYTGYNHLSKLFFLIPDSFPPKNKNRVIMSYLISHRSVCSSLSLFLGMTFPQTIFNRIRVFHRFVRPVSAHF